jgi:SAM-dependent methyltransferase
MLMTMLELASLKDIFLNEIKSRLLVIYQREAFFPKLLGLFINPFYFARKGLSKHISDLANNINGKTLDVGCGTKPYAHLYQSKEYVGLEIDTPQNRVNKQAEFYYDGNNFPFEDASFDSLVANEVFEHVFNPDIFLSETLRILKPNGMILLTMPFVWDEHEQPYDFARYTSFGIKSLLERHGFEIVEQRKSTDDIRVIFQLINTYIFKKTVTKNAYINVLTTFLLMAPFNIIGELLSFITPRNNDLFLDNIVLARKMVD